jgi:hypothetical protein
VVWCGVVVCGVVWCVPCVSFRSLLLQTMARALIVVALLAVCALATVQAVPHALAQLHRDPACTAKSGKCVAEAACRALGGHIDGGCSGRSPDAKGYV